jgi:VanZ family protein
MGGVTARYGPPVALMALIFVLSAQPDVGADHGTFEVVLRKLGHMTGYGLLWFLWWRALGGGSPAPAVAITLAYAATDEIHQTFVTGRHGTPVDVLIDAAGVALAILAVTLARRRRRVA